MIDLNIITQAEIQNFIIDNTNTDLTQFLLKTNPFPNLSIQEIAQQIKGRQIAQKKFPFLLKEGIVFPPHLNIEQASSPPGPTTTTQSQRSKVIRKNIP